MIGIEIVITTSVIVAEVEIGTRIGIGLVIVNAVGVIGTTMIDTGTVIVMTTVHVGDLLINYLKQSKRD